VPPRVGPRASAGEKKGVAVLRLFLSQRRRPTNRAVTSSGAVAGPRLVRPLTVRRRDKQDRRLPRRDLREAGEQGKHTSSDGSTLRLGQCRLNLRSFSHLSITDASWLRSSRRPLVSSAEEQRRRCRWRRGGCNRRLCEQTEADGSANRRKQTEMSCRHLEALTGAPRRRRPRAGGREQPYAFVRHRGSKTFSSRARTCRAKSRRCSPGIKEARRAPLAHLCMFMCVHACAG
jgi:hypothetical protein